MPQINFMSFVFELLVFIFLFLFVYLNYKWDVD